MALQWAILASVVLVEAAIAIILTLPLPQLLKSPVVTLASLLLKLSAGVFPFAVLQLIDLYWKKEHFLICVSEVCTASERDRYEKSKEEVVRKSAKEKTSRSIINFCSMFNSYLQNKWLCSFQPLSITK